MAKHVELIETNPVLYESNLVVASTTKYNRSFLVWYQVLLYLLTVSDSD